MDKIKWQEHHGFDDADMQQIEMALELGGKITAIRLERIKYETIAYNRG